MEREINKLFENEKPDVFIDASVFDETYIPDKFKYREEEIEDLAFLMKGLFDKITRNCHISGLPGTGKTQIIKKLMNGFNEKAKELKKNIQIIHAPCRGKSYATVVENFLLLLDDREKTKGIGTDKILEKIRKKIRNKYVCFIFDEIDRLVPTSSHPTPLTEAIGTFSRFSDEGNYHVSLFTISNSSLIEKSLDDSVKDSWRPKYIEFKQYTKRQIYAILKERVKKGFVDDIISDNTLENLGKRIVDEDESLRLALRVLSDAGQEIRKKSRKKITQTIIDKCYKEAEERKIFNAVSDLRMIQLILLFFIAKLNGNGKKPTTEMIYREYREFCRGINIEPKTMRHVSGYVLPRLLKTNLIYPKMLYRGRKNPQIKTYEIDSGDYILKATSQFINERLPERTQIEIKKIPNLDDYR